LNFIYTFKHQQTCKLASL